MKPFLKQVLEEIIRNHPDDLDQVCLVLPGKRPAVYLKKYFGELLDRTSWLPDMLAINQFVEEVTAKKVGMKDDLLFEFFQIYQKQTYYSGETFDSFLQWGPQAITDYNDVDNYLKDGKYIFQDLTNLKEMDEWGRIENDDEDFQWSFNQKPLSRQQENFLSFWEKLGKLYASFRAFCLSNDLYYSGLTNRVLADNIVMEKETGNSLYSEATFQSIEKKIDQWSKIYFIGLHALSSAEEKFVFELTKLGKAKTYWDADSFYLDNPMHEAGKFLRRYVKKEKVFSWKGNFISKKQLSINIHETSTDFAQVKYVGELLKKNPQWNKAVILGNENLLIPLLHSLPDLTNKVNITLGFPLVNTAFFEWVKKSIALLKNQSRGLYFTDFQEWITHSFVVAALEPRNKELLDDFNAELIRDNIVYIREDEMVSLSRKSDFFEQLLSVFVQEYSLLNFIDYLISCALIFRNSLKNDKIQQESLYEFLIILNRLKKYAEKFSFVETLDTFDRLFDKITRSTSLSFLGEPLQGDQIMGMLESRTLDFDQVIILGANEGYLPGAKRSNSFIPFELRRYYGLPTHHENEVIFAYNFYRLLQRSSQADIFYSTAKVSFGSSEPSRYIAQIRNEFPELVKEINEDIILTPQVINKQKEVVIEVDQTIIEEVKKMLIRGVSPSALNTFLRCPLDFYYRYVVGLSEVEEVEEDIQLNTFGTIVHGVLEEFYKEIEGQYLTEKHIDDWENRISGAAEKAFLEVFKTGNFTQGVNYIALQVAQRYLQDFFVQERREVQKLAEDHKSIKIVALEQYLTYTLNLEEFGCDFPVTIRGFADRIDQIAGKTRIVDYKTGGVKPADLNVKYDFSDLLAGKKPKALQVLIYALLYHKMNETPMENIDSGIISFKNIDQGFMSFGITKISKESAKSGIKPPENLKYFLEEKLAELVLKMTEPDQVWQHNERSDFCGYCG